MDQGPEVIRNAEKLSRPLAAVSPAANTPIIYMKTEHNK